MKIRGCTLWMELCGLGSLDSWMVVRLGSSSWEDVDLCIGGGWLEMGSWMYIRRWWWVVGDVWLEICKFLDRGEWVENGGLSFVDVDLWLEVLVWSGMDAYGWLKISGYKFVNAEVGDG